MADRLTHGTHQFGERNAQAKLTAPDVQRIRKLAPSKTLRELSKEFGVGESHLSTIIRRKSWPHVN
jgi:hypothetical protein